MTIINDDEDDDDDDDTDTLMMKCSVGLGWGHVSTDNQSGGLEKEGLG